ncbi:hypothetical protein EV121DRAFT_296899 [Schizophyllum commune]
MAENRRVWCKLGKMAYMHLQMDEEDLSDEELEEEAAEKKMLAFIDYSTEPATVSPVKGVAFLTGPAPTGTAVLVPTPPATPALQASPPLPVSPATTASSVTVGRVADRSSPTATLIAGDPASIAPVAVSPEPAVGRPAEPARREGEGSCATLDGTVSGSETRSSTVLPRADKKGARKSSGSSGAGPSRCAHKSARKSFGSGDTGPSSEVPRADQKIAGKSTGSGEAGPSSAVSTSNKKFWRPIC